MSRVISTRGGAGQNFDTLFPEPLPEIFADGVAELMLGYPVCKFTLFQSRPSSNDRLENGEPLESREAKLIVSMSLSAFVQSFSNMLAVVLKNEPSLAESVSAHAKSTLQLLASISDAKPDAAN